MKILEKRPLALILCIMLGGFSFFADFEWEIKLIVSAVSLLLIGIIFIFDNLKKGRNALTVISLAALCISVLLSLLWTKTFYPEKIYGTETQIEATVYDIDNSSSTTSVMVIKTDKINGKRDKHTFLLYVDKELGVKVRKYDVISITAYVNEFSVDSKSYYTSSGYSAICQNVTELSVIGKNEDKVDAFLDSLRLKICNRLKMRTNFETGAFLSALIVGDRTDLSGNTRLNFARLGISHILALSGMHLAILSVALNMLLTKLGVSKKPRVAVLSLAVLFYMGLTGFSASVVRAGCMLIISGVLYLLMAKSDPLTALTISVFIIVVANPCSVFDLSLWLSAFATLGVIVFAEITERPDELASRPKKLWILFKNSCLVSVFAFCATFAFTALRFNSFSVVFIFTTLIFSFVIQFLIYGGILLLLIGGLIPFGKLIILLSDAILWLAEKISSWKMVYVPMDFVFVRVLIALLTVFFFAFLVLDIKKKRIGIAIIVVMLTSVSVVAEADAMISLRDDGITFAPSPSGDVMLLKSDADVTAIYSGKAFKDNSWDILDYFTEEGLTYIDNLVFASYSYSTIDFMNAIIDGIKVEHVMLPRPNTDDEIGQAEGISYLLEGYGATLEFYELTEYISFGEYKYRLFEKVDYTYGEYPENVYEIVAGEERFTYLSTCKYEDLSASAKILIRKSENLFIGTIGNSKYYIFDMRIDSIKNIYYYDDGRLSEDAEKYYKEKGASIEIIKAPIRISD